MNGDSPQQLKLSLNDIWKLQSEVRRIRLPSVRSRARRDPGQRPSPFHGRGMSFTEHRSYQPGDDIRHIDWRVTARHNHPYTKCFEEERERPLLLLCDLTSSLVMSSGTVIKSHRTVEAAALMAWLGLSRGDRIGAIIASPAGIESFRPARRRQTVLKIMDALVRHHNALVDTPNTGSQSQLDKALAEATRTIKHGGRIVIIGDFHDTPDNTTALVQSLASRNSVMALRICDPLELRPPPPGHYGLMADGQPLWVNAGNPAFRDSLSRRLEQHERHLAQLFTRAGSHFVQHCTDSSLSPVLANMAA